jgi:4-hydroxymandelate oxidase
MAQRRTAGPGFRTLAELEQRGVARLAPAVRDYVETGAGGEKTRTANEAAFDAWSLVPRVLEDVRAVDLATAVLDHRLPVPFFAAPTAYHGAIHPDGERATARALARAGVLGVYSTLSTRALEEIADASGAAPRWFQLYPQPELDASLAMVRRAERSGFSAVVVTVDAPVLGVRDTQARRGFAIVGSLPLGNGREVRTPGRGMKGRNGHYSMEGVGEYSWAMFDQVVESTDLPVVIKGVLSPVDAQTAIEHGARGIVVSNHGGRQLDRSVPALVALPDVVKAVGRRAEVYLDGSVRRGPDVLVAAALGARACGLGRPVLWALAAGGERGVARLLELLSEEIAVSLALLGRRSMGDVDRTAVRPSPLGQGRRE